MSNLKHSIARCLTSRIITGLISSLTSFLITTRFITSHLSRIISRSYLNLTNFIFCFALLTSFTSVTNASVTNAASVKNATSATTTATKTIGISQIVEHPALDAVRHGMLDELKRQGFQEGENLTVVYENAQGSVVTSTQIANKLLSGPLDVGVAISTPSAQTLFFAAQKQGKKVPIVFSAVSDPLAAKLELANGQVYPITGVTDAPNLEGLLELVLKMMPKLKTLGIMYNPSEANSVATVKKLRKLLVEKGIEAREATVTKTADVAQVTQSLIGNVDALYFPQDNTVVAAIETVVGIANHAQPPMPVILPIFTTDPVLVKKGVLAAVGFDYVQVGAETGKVVAKILRGEKANDIPIHNPEQLKAVINRALAEKLKLPIPDSLQLSEISFID